MRKALAFRTVESAALHESSAVSWTISNVYLMFPNLLCVGNADSVAYI